MIRRSTLARLGLWSALLLVASALPAAPLHGGLAVRASGPAPPPSALPDPMPVWEAFGRGLATLRMDPEAFGQPVLYPLEGAGGPIFVQLDNLSGSRLVLGEEDFLHFSDPGAQDGFLLPPPTAGRTQGFWSSWANRFHPELVARWLDWVEADSILFGPGELFGTVEVDDLDEILAGGDTSPQGKLRAQLLTTWLSVEAGLLAPPVRVEPGAAASLLGPGPLPLHLDPVVRGPVSQPRGGVLGAVELLAASGSLDRAEIETLKDLLDRINNGASETLPGGAVVERGQVWENLIAQFHPRSLYSRLEGLPAWRQPPGLASVWTCTEGLGLSQVVATTDFGVGGEILPPPLASYARVPSFGVVLWASDRQSPRDAVDRVRLLTGGQEHLREIVYDPSTPPHDQLRAFVAEITRGTGLEAVVREVPFSRSTLLYAVVRGGLPWKIDPVEASDGRPWIRSPRSDVDEAIWAGFGEPLQYLVWLHLEENPAVLVGKTPLVAAAQSLGTVPVRVRVTNIGKTASGPVHVTDRVPAGLEPTGFDPSPDRLSGSISQGWTLEWSLPALAGGEAGGVHPDHRIRYELRGAVNERTQIPGVEARWNGTVSRSAPTLLLP